MRGKFLEAAVFDGDEISASVLLLTDGHDIYAVPVRRVGIKHWEIKTEWHAEKLEGLSVVAVALSIKGANRDDLPKAC